MASFRFSIPNFAAGNDPRAHREEDLTAARLAAQKNTRSNVASNLAAPYSAGPRLDGAASDSPDQATSSAPPRRRLVFPDPVAFRYLAEDPAVTVIEKQRNLQGYELYLVEQWACSRQTPTLVIATYTGDPNHSIVVGVLGVPAQEGEWSPRLKVYFKNTQKYHARSKETPLGDLMVTNLSSFPSALTVIPVPDGDIRKHRTAFIVNENLKRLGCSGRSGMTLSEPTKATQDKFTSLYKTSERISFDDSVVELVKMCQVALFLFGELEQEYIDGLLCDVTEKAINDWWTKVGSEYHNVEPTDGILGPTTVAALLGLLIGARNRLSWYGTPIAKDVFDIENSKRGIGAFQKAHRLDRTRRLDHNTLRTLHSVSAKAAAGEGWGVQKAVKSTVEGFGGKRGELVIGMVGGKDKGNIGDVETIDIDKFISLVHGERAKWLWYGKTRRLPIDHHDRERHDMGNVLLGREDAAASTSGRTQSLPPEDELDISFKNNEPESGVLSPAVTASSTIDLSDSPGDKEALRRAVFKNMAGKVSDARSGFGRFKDAVVGGGSRGHAARASRDETMTGGIVMPGLSVPSPIQAPSTGPPTMSRAFTWKNKPEEYLNAFRREAETASTPVADEESQLPSSTHDQSQDVSDAPRREADGQEPPATADISVAGSEIRRGSLLQDISTAGSVVGDGDLEGPILAAERQGGVKVSALQRRHSIGSTYQWDGAQTRSGRYERRMSFTVAEEAVLTWRPVAPIPHELSRDSDLSLQEAQGHSGVAMDLYQQMYSLQQDVGPWITDKLASLDQLDHSYGRQQAEVQDLYYHLSEAYQRSSHQSRELIGEERSHVTEAVKDVETLVQRLEYEINTLMSKVQDVEDGVHQFELQVEGIEARAEELKAQLETESWVHWFVRTLTGIGTGPRITRAPQNTS